MKALNLLSGQRMPVLGQGTWGIGERSGKRQTEVAALRLGLDLGMTLIDTAEMYGDGGAEKVVGEAIAGRRNEVFLVGKIQPHNASRKGAARACEQSLRRLRTESIDLYLLHWRESSPPLSETLEAFQVLKDSGKIREYGVSNFDLGDLEEAVALPGGNEIATNQVLYNLMHRGIEWDLLSWCRRRRMPVMAYSPIERGEILNHSALKLVALRHGASPAQIALSWLLQQPCIAVIAKAGNPAHVRENRAAMDLSLSDSDLLELDRLFPRPGGKVPLEMK